MYKDSIWVDWNGETWIGAAMFEANLDYVFCAFDFEEMQVVFRRKIMQLMDHTMTKEDMRGWTFATTQEASDEIIVRSVCNAIKWYHPERLACRQYLKRHEGLIALLTAKIHRKVREQAIISEYCIGSTAFRTITTAMIICLLKGCREAAALQATPQIWEERKRRYHRYGKELRSGRQVVFQLMEKVEGKLPLELRETVLEYVVLAVYPDPIHIPEDGHDADNRANEYPADGSLERISPRMALRHIEEQFVDIRLDSNNGTYPYPHSLTHPEIHLVHGSEDWRLRRQGNEYSPRDLRFRLQGADYIPGDLLISELKGYTYSLDRPVFEKWRNTLRSAFFRNVTFSRNASDPLPAYLRSNARIVRNLHLKVNLSGPQTIVNYFRNIIFIVHSLTTLYPKLQCLRYDIVMTSLTKAHIYLDRTLEDMLTQFVAEIKKLDIKVRTVALFGDGSVGKEWSVSKKERGDVIDGKELGARDIVGEMMYARGDEFVV